MRKETFNDEKDDRIAACSADDLRDVHQGCGEKGTTLKSVQKAGKLTIATSPDFPPFESLGDNNEVVGIEIDVLNLICEQLGVTLEINQMDFDSVLPGVQAGKFDVGVSGISVTEKSRCGR